MIKITIEDLDNNSAIWSTITEEAINSTPEALKIILSYLEEKAKHKTESCGNPTYPDTYYYTPVI